MIKKGGTLAQIHDQVAAIENFIDGWNNRCQRITWTKTADKTPALPPGKDPHSHDTVT